MEDIENVLAVLPRHPLFLSIPEALKGWLLEIDWDMDALHRLNLPVRSMPVTELTWHLLLPWWRRGDLVFQVRPIDVWCQPSDYREHVDRTEACDLSHPLDIIRRAERWLILDGIHRLLKACQAGLRNVDVRILEPGDLFKIARR